MQYSTPFFALATAALAVMAKPMPQNQAVHSSVTVEPITIVYPSTTVQPCILVPAPTGNGPETVIAPVTTRAHGATTTYYSVVYPTPSSAIHAINQNERQGGTIQVATPSVNPPVSSRLVANPSVGLPVLSSSLVVVPAPSLGGTASASPPSEVTTIVVPVPGGTQSAGVEPRPTTYSCYFTGPLPTAVTIAFPEPVGTEHAAVPAPTDPTVPVVGATAPAAVVHTILAAVNNVTVAV